MIELSISQLIVLCGGFFIVLIGIGQMLSPKKERNLVLAWMLIILGYTHALYGGIYSQLSSSGPLYSVLKLISISSYFATGPLIYFYTSYLLEYNYSIKKNDLIHFIPVPISALIVFFAFLIPHDSDPLIVQILAGLTVMSLGVYSLFILFCFFKFYRKTLPEKKMAVILPVILLILAIVVSSLFDILNRLFTLHLKNMILVFNTSCTLFFYFLCVRTPGYFIMLQKEAERISYEHSSLAGIDVNEVVKKITEYMTEDHLYCDASLNLKKLAHKTGVTQHQLSEILNVRMKKNFRSFINEYRIKKACLLLTEKEQSVISIAYAAGFDTPSAFYTAFKKECGLTPTQFKKTKKPS